MKLLTSLLVLVGWVAAAFVGGAAGLYAGVGVGDAISEPPPGSFMFITNAVAIGALVGLVVGVVVGLWAFAAIRRWAGGVRRRRRYEEELAARVEDRLSE